jgi:hypothetical protein
MLRRSDLIVAPRPCRLPPLVHFDEHRFAHCDCHLALRVSAIDSQTN